MRQEGTRKSRAFLAIVLRFGDHSNRDLLFSKTARDTFAQRGLTLAGGWAGGRGPASHAACRVGTHGVKEPLSDGKDSRAVWCQSGQLLQPGLRPAPQLQHGANICAYTTSHARALRMPLATNDRWLSLSKTLWRGKVNTSQKPLLTSSLALHSE